METILNIILIVGITVGLAISIGMIIEFFGLAKNVKRIRELLENQNKQKDADEPCKVPYTENEGTITFDTGEIGKISMSIGQYRVDTKKGIQYFIKKNDAIEALYIDICNSNRDK